MDWYNQPRELLFREYLRMREWRDEQYATNPDVEESHVSGLLQVSFEVREIVDFHIFNEEWTTDEPIEIFDLDETFVLRKLRTLSKWDHFDILETLVVLPGGRYGSCLLRAVARYYQYYTMDAFGRMGGPRNLLRVFCDAMEWARPIYDESFSAMRRMDE
ncbi:hypothetical protein CFAM422_008555 [Trichoderma lentiforme]|uniref:Uncharacterized protein n=1 Tax=Trichoderma lentiforme TaxID=1567552 RepID=A0A9P4XBA0_9HYPO|nr:hypothetical protein CFAM422_008555 [Trichoderma lentiforme]